MNKITKYKTIIRCLESEIKDILIEKTGETEEEANYYIESLRQALDYDHDNL